MFPTFRNEAIAPAHRLSNLLDHFFADAPASAKPTTVVPLAIWEDAAEVRVELDLPGVAEADLDISLHDNVLTVAAERKADKADARFDTRRYGKFEQRVSVPVTVDDSSVSATYTNGVLAVTMSKVPEPKPRKISVNVKTDAVASAEQN